MSSRPADTTKTKLYDLMYNSVVDGVYIEFLIPRTKEGAPEFTADPTKRSRGKQKNHVVVRFQLQKPFYYVRNGDQKTCGSVRASVEPGDGVTKGTWISREITLKPLPNTIEASTSASAAFQFWNENGRTIREFVSIAKHYPDYILLPFRYVVVSKTIYPNPQSPGTSLVDWHANGCRDFTAQWWALLYQSRFVGWRVTYSSVPEVKLNEPFDVVVAYRFSRGGPNGVVISHSLIQQARFLGKCQRQMTVSVGDEERVLPYDPQVEPDNTEYDGAQYSDGGSYEPYNVPSNYAWPLGTIQDPNSISGQWSNYPYPLTNHDPRYAQSSQSTGGYGSYGGATSNSSQNFSPSYSSSGPGSSQYSIPLPATNAAGEIDHIVHYYPTAYGTSGYANQPDYGAASSSSNQYATSGYANDPNYGTAGSSSNQSFNTGRYSRRFNNDDVAYSRRR